MNPIYETDTTPLVDVLLEYTMLPAETWEHAEQQLSAQTLLDAIFDLEMLLDQEAAWIPECEL